jgi:hypothetical protein
VEKGGAKVKEKEDTRKKEGKCKVKRKTVCKTFLVCRKGTNFILKELNNGLLLAG